MGAGRGPARPRVGYHGVVPTRGPGLLVLRAPQLRERGGVEMLRAIGQRSADWGRGVDAGAGARANEVGARERMVRLLHLIG